jgi:hypothetical protein
VPNYNESPTKLKSTFSRRKNTLEPIDRHTYLKRGMGNGGAPTNFEARPVLTDDGTYEMQNFGARKSSVNLARKRGLHGYEYSRNNLGHRNSS